MLWFLCGIACGDATTSWRVGSNLTDLQDSRDSPKLSPASTADATNVSMVTPRNTSRRRGQGGGEKEEDRRSLDASVLAAFDEIVLWSEPLLTTLAVSHYAPHSGWLQKPASALGTTLALPQSLA